jgi:hypothetical protein
MKRLLLGTALGCLLSVAIARDLIVQAEGMSVSTITM